MKYIALVLIVSISVFSQNSYLSAYTSYSEMKSELSKLGVKQKTIAKTKQGRDVTLVQFGSDDAPAIFVVGNIDGDYYVGTELAMRLIKDLKNKKINRNGKTIYVVPMPNPDAVEFGFKNPEQPMMYNSNVSDDDRDQKVNEDGYNDLNKDGIISHIRVKDDLGEYSADKTYDGLLKKIDRLKGESGSYNVFIEGKDDDDDGKRDEDGFGGTNINQNFTYNYEYFGKGTGLNQVSEPETKAIADFVFDHPNILMTVAFSKYDNILKLWNVNKKATKDLKRPLRSFTTMLKEDKDSYTMFAEHWKSLNKGWNTKGKDKKNVGDGTFHEWSYYHTGRWSISLNGWNINQIKLDTGVFKKQSKMKLDEKLYHYAVSNKLKKAVLPWTKINHPDFKRSEVEVGGFHSSYRTNPASEIFTSTKSSEFIESLTSFFPKITVTTLDVKELSDGLYRVTLGLKNVGKLATQSAMGAKSGWMYPVRAVWNTKKEDFISGVKKTLLSPIEGFGGEQEIQWVIKAKSGSTHTLEIISPTVGKITKKVEMGE